MNKYANNSHISLPLAIWSLMDNYNYDSRDNAISVTTLLKPIRQIVLGRRYKDNIKEIDAENLIASSMGTALHTDICYAIARECPNNNYHVFKDLYGTIPDEFKEKLNEEYNQEKLDKQNKE